VESCGALLPSRMDHGPQGDRRPATGSPRSWICAISTPLAGRIGAWIAEDLAVGKERRYSRRAMRLIALTLLSLLCGCAYVRKETHTMPMAAAAVKLESRPSGMWTFQVLSAELPQRKPSGLPWDDDGSGPDPFVRIYLNDRELWQSPVIEDTTQPAWNVTLPANVVIASNAKLRLEVWDFDSQVKADPMGGTATQGLPGNAMPDAEARVTLDNLANLTIKVSEPRPMRGVGLTVEIRPNALRVIEVQPYSPASRANIRVGEDIIAIGDTAVSSLNDNDAFSRLSLALDSGATLSIVDQGGTQRSVQLDKDPIWRTM